MHGEKRSTVTDETITRRIRDEIIPILYQVVLNDEIRYRNPHSVACWEKNSCTNTDCPAYGQGLSAGDLLERADEAMYKAKSEGKNKVARYGLECVGQDRCNPESR